MQENISYLLILPELWTKPGMTIVDALNIHIETMSFMVQKKWPLLIFLFCILTDSETNRDIDKETQYSTRRSISILMMKRERTRSEW